MNRFIAQLLILIFWLAAAPRAECGDVQNASDIFRQFTDATHGGALANRQSMLVEGRIVSIQQNFSGNIRILKARPARLLVETMIDGYGTVRICFDGTNAWQSEPNQPLRRLSSSVIQDLREEADFMPANHLSDRVKSVRFQGHNIVNQIPCNRVQVICNDGSEVFEDFSRATSLLVARSKPGRATELYGEYRAFGGVLVPTRVETRRDNQAEQIVTITNVTFDVAASSEFDAARYDFKLRRGFLAPTRKNTKGEFDRVDGAVTEAMDDLGIPGLALAVVRNGKIVKAAGYGIADLQNKTPVLCETVFEIGSVTKVFTAATIMQLVQEKKPKLDDTLTKWLTNCPPTWRRITVRRLLTHTAGLRQSVYCGTLFREIPDDEIIREAAKFPLEFQPGENWAYSNIGYQLLGAVITRATDMPWPESLNRRIFEPLGMMNTERLTASAKASHRAIGYSLADNGELKPGLYDPSGTAAGSFLSTIGDLAKLDAALYVDSVLTQKTRAQMSQPARLNRGIVNWYAMGWFLDEYKNHRMVYHGGDTVSGFTSLLMRFPEQKLTIILLCNRVGVDKQRLGRSVADEFLSLPAENAR